jgi:hypothetical protein
MPGNGGLCPECASYVRPPRVSVEPALWRHAPRPRKWSNGRQVPTARQLAGQCFGRVCSAPERPIEIARHVGDCVRIRSWHHVGDELCEEAVETAKAALLPSSHEPTSPPLIRDRRPGASKRQATTLAFGTPFDGPRGRSPAARAHRRAETTEGLSARRAEKRLTRRARGTADRHEKIEKRRSANPHATRVAWKSAQVLRNVCRFCAGPCYESRMPG